MSDIAKAKPVQHLDSTVLTAADTFRETFSGDDEETGLDPNVANYDSSARPIASAQPQQKNKTMWMVGATVLVIALGVIIALATQGGGGGEETSAASTAVGSVPSSPSEPVVVDVLPEPPSTPEASSPVEEPTVETPVVVDLEPSMPSEPTIVLGADELVNVSSDDIGSDEEKNPDFQPEVSVGDSALLNPSLPELVASTTTTTTSAPTPSPTKPVISEPINNIIATTIASPDPTPSPSAAPSKEPTPEPSAEPSKKPTEEPTKSPTVEPTPPPSKSPTLEPTPEPTQSPTKKPVVQLDLSGWSNFNWSGETPAPTDSPSVSPTPNPTNEPTPAPTNEPTSEPSEKPTSSPTPAPTDSPTASPTTGAPTDSPTPKNPYFMGESFYTYSEDGVDLDVSTGLTVRLIAKTGSKVKFANGGESKDSWHTRTDAAGIISMNPADPLNSPYAYLSNSEEGDGDGGVYGLYFDKDGNIIDYKALLTGTTDNCGGGHTPWNTWISCEEFSDGQCWQIDPYTGEAKETELGGSGGRYESVAVDNRNPANPVFFTTEDDEEGALRRFIANGNGWDALHSDGEHSYLNILSDSTFEWTDDLDVGRQSASKHFPNSEGIQVHEGKVYFMAKELQRLLILDLETNTYTTEGTGKKFYGEGDFGEQPDQNLFGPTRKYMYFTEDGGKDPGVYARYGTDETYFTMFQGNLSEEDETVGIALSPDHKVFYAALQDHGMVYEFRREDGLPFE